MHTGKVPPTAADGELEELGLAVHLMHLRLQPLVLIRELHLEHGLELIRVVTVAVLQHEALHWKPTERKKEREGKASDERAARRRDEA